MSDRPVLKSFYGQEFREGALPGNPRVEQISKADVLRGLARATRRNTMKKSYDKGLHSFAILGEINPGVVERAAPYAKRFLDTLRAGSLP